MEYKIVIDQQVIDQYCEEYFKVHPRASKPPVDSVHPYSLNKLLVSTKFQRNHYKGAWKDIGMWLIKKLGYENLQLEKFEMEVSVYKWRKNRFDLDNFGSGAIKLLADAFTESGFIIDDNVTNLTKLTITGGYDKDHPRTEFLIRTIEEENTKGE